MESEEKYKEPEFGFEDRILDELFREEASLVPASKNLRFVNYLFDHMILGIIQFFFLLTMGGMIQYYEGINGSEILTQPQDTSVLIVFLTGLSFYISYYVLCEYFGNGQTLGKKITGTKVVMKNGDQPTLFAILIRTFARYIPFEIFSYLGSGSEGWHDQVSNTRVIVNSPK